MRARKSQAVVDLATACLRGLVNHAVIATACGKEWRLSLVACHHPLDAEEPGLDEQTGLWLMRES